MENPDKSTARVECWNDLRDEKSTESRDKLFQNHIFHTADDSHKSAIKSFPVVLTE